MFGPRLKLTDRIGVFWRMTELSAGCCPSLTPVPAALITITNIRAVQARHHAVNGIHRTIGAFKSVTTERVYGSKTSPEDLQQQTSSHVYELQFKCCDFIGFEKSRGVSTGQVSEPLLAQLQGVCNRDRRVNTPPLLFHLGICTGTCIPQSRILQLVSCTMK